MLKKLWIIFLTGILIITLSSLTLSEEPEDWPHPDEMEFAEIDITVREAEEFELDNGLTIYLMEDRDLPLIEGRAIIDAGNIYSPQEKTGLAEMTANLLRTGGTDGLHPDEIDERLEYLAASIEVGAQNIISTAGFSSLSENKEEIISLFNDILRKPDFLEERIDLSRGKLEESIRRRDDNPVQLAVQEFIKKMAEDHPVGWFPTLDSVNNIKRGDLMNFHEKYYKPQAVTLAITGDFDKNEMLKLLKDKFGSWEAEKVDYPELPEFDPEPEPKVYHVQQPIQQSIIFIGHPSVTFDSKKFAPLNLANRILGGGGDNRLFRELRSRRGLAYAVGSQLTQGFEYPGFFFAFAITAANNTGNVIELVKSEINKIREEKVTEEELKENRQAILNRAVYRYTSAGDITSRQALINYLNLDPDYYERYIDQIQNIDKKVLLNIAGEEFRPDQAIIMVVGNEMLFDRDLEEFGEVEQIEIEF